MKRNTAKQKWRAGNQVRIGYLELVVTNKVPTPKGEPDAFELESLDRTRHYRFQPYRGLARVS